eukprot:TRINITY_DN62320_c0_g1_i1.p1 TRINITY_DN62320_c0_g1~~TRINITY_DN62320_c0_g1_i1.p1  ORF type:complete len:205 (-),score=40.72 TRINITY_DN62320_c0_g1_i1:57-671(-)
MMCFSMFLFFFFQAEDGIRDAQESRGLGDVYKRQFMNLLGMATLTLNTSRFHLHNNSVNTSVPFATNYCKIFVAQVSGLHADTTLRSSFEVTSNRLNANIHPTVLTGDAAIVYIGDELNTLSKNTVLVAQNSYAISPESYNTNALVLLLSSAAPGSIMTMCANIIGSNIYSKTKKTCLLYTSDAADEEDSVDLGGRRIIKKKKT